MFPIIKIFNREITTYAIMALVGVLLTGFYVSKEAKKRKKDDNEIIILLLISAIGIFIGSHLLYGIVNIHELKALNTLTSFDIKKILNILAITFGGSVFYGGLIGGLIAAFIYIKKKNIDNEYVDIAASSIPLFHGIARIGCFLAGCCYGIESKIGFTYKHALIESANHVSRFPVQLLEALLNIILFFVLKHLLKNKKCEGKIIYIYLISYSVIRFFDEFLRGDSYRGFVGCLSTSQFISILIFAITIIILIVKKYKKNKSK